MQQSVIEQIKHRLPVADVLGSYITLQQSGGQFKARCPFHNERTPSFSISPERGVYYCFGCGAKGDIFSFVQQFEGLDFKAALTILADRAGIVLSESDAPVADTDVVYAAMEQATVMYQEELVKHPEVLEYLTKRGITKESIAEFRLGYAPTEWRFIGNSAAALKHVEHYERAGLIKKTDKGFYDRFRGRIMFPLSDSSGRVVAFSGRMFPDTPEGPKYLNSPETELFQKSHILYGFDKAKIHIKKNNFAILVEGQMDMVLSHQYGFKNTIATSGTAVSEHAAFDPGAQLGVIARLTPNIFLAFDGDSAGEKALSRAALVALSLGLNPKVVPLPPGVDPADQLLAGGAEQWKTLLQQSTHFVMHALSLVRRDTSSPHALVLGLKEKILPFLARVASPVEQQLYIDALAKDLEMTSAAIAEELAVFKKAQPQTQQSSLVQQATAQVVNKQITITPQERLLGLIERYPHEDNAALIAKLTTINFDGNTIVMPTLSEEQMMQALAIVEAEYGLLDHPARILAIEELVKKIIDAFFAELRIVYTARMRDAERNGDTALADTTLAQLQNITAHRHGI